MMLPVALAITGTLLVVTGYKPECPSGWLPRPGTQFCYKFYNSDVKYSWTEAEALCESFGGTLITIKDGPERVYLSEMATTQQYAADTFLVGLKLNKTGTELLWYWVDDGTKIDYNVINWVQGHPDVHGNLPCAMYQTGANPKDKSGLVDTFCNEPYNFICKRSLATPTMCDISAGWTQVGDSCMYFPIYMWAESFVQSEYMCEAYGGELVILDSIAKQTFALQILKEHTTDKVWLGLYNTINGTYEWLHNETGIPANWAPGEPTDATGAEEMTYCATLWASDGKWHTTGCYDSVEYICQKPLMNCPAGWQEDNGMCYQWNNAFEDSLMFDDALAKCEAQNTNVLEIHDSDRNIYVWTQTFQRHWLGLTNKGSTGPAGHYHWLSDPQGNVRNGYTDFIGNKTTCGSDETCCGAVDSTRSYYETWETQPCDNTEMYVCSAPVGTNITHNETFEGYSCDEDWDLFGAYCYIVSSVPTKWQVANNLCKDNSSNLVSIFHGDEQAYLDNIFKVDYWIGLNRLTGGGENFVWSNNAGDPIPITDHTYRNWATESGKKNESNSCAFVSNKYDDEEQIYNGYWKVDYCPKQRQFACKKPAKKSSTTPGSTTMWPSQCGPYWVLEPVTGACYRASDDAHTFDDAEDYCQAIGGHLASMHTPSEQSVVLGYVTQFFEGPVDIWIGSYQKGNYLGWTWTDGSAYNYINWEPGQPMLSWIEDCTVMTTQGTWQAASCTARRSYLCKKWGDQSITTTTPFNPPPTQQPGQYYGCPSSEWQDLFHYCYRVEGTSEYDAKSFESAKDHCRRLGGDLASVDNFDENDFILSLLRTTQNDSLWIGLNDISHDGLYSWTDGEDVRFTYWDYAQPSDFSREHCVEIMNEHAHWHTRSCEDTLPYICKTKKTLQAATSEPPPPSGCPPGTSAYREKCYRVYDQTEKTFGDASSDCNMFYGSLPIITNNYQQAYLSSLIGQYSGEFWIGLLTLDGDSYNWVNGDPVSGYDNWYKDYPDSRYGMCVYATSASPPGLWKNGKCNDAKHFLCETQREGWTEPWTTTTPVPSSDYCPKEWISYKDGRKCFGVFGKFQGTQTFYDDRNYDAAQRFCQDMGGNLASIPDEGTQSFLASKINEYSNFWIGLNSLDGQSWDSWGWTDGTAIGYVAWDTNQPVHDTHENLRCVQMTAYSNGLWSDAACNVHNAWICETTMGSSTMSTQSFSPTPSPRCQNDPNYVYFPRTDACYMLSEYWYNAPWEAAKTQCAGAKVDQYLLSITDKYEEDFILDMLQAEGFTWDNYWIGFTKMGHEGGQFGWVDGSAADFDYWGPNEPSDEGYGETDGCASISTTNGEWMSENCGVFHPYICKWYANSKPVIPTEPPPKNGNCPSDWFKSDSKCYKVFPSSYYPEYSDWKGSLHLCKALAESGAKNPNLASILDEKAQLAILAHIKGIGQHIWIGLTDNDDGYTFQWADNSPLTYTYWAPGEPNYFNNQEFCVEMYDFTQKAGMWNDIACYNIQPYLCERDPDPTLPTPTPETSTCGKGFVLWKTEYSNDISCYKVLETSGTWAEMEAECQSFSEYTHLVSITDTFEEAFVRFLVYDELEKESFWIGLTDQNKQQVYEWIDGWPVVYSHWGPDQPTALEGQGCAILQQGQDGRWVDENCTATYRGICKNTEDTKPTAEPSQCPGMVCPPTKPGEQWVNGGGCYCYLIIKDSVDEAHAQQACMQREANLVSVHSYDEQVWITSKISPYVPSEFWIGLVKDFTTGGWQWTDGTGVDYDYFYWQGYGSCVTMPNSDQIWNAQWNTKDCDELHPYVCKAHKEPPKQTTYSPPPPCSSDSSYYSRGDYCYKIYSDYFDSTTWNKAEKACEKDGATLLSITTSGEQDFIVEILQKDGSVWTDDDYWIGLNILTGDGTFHWADGSIFDYAKWEDNQPNKDYFCVLLDHSSDPPYQWKTEHCAVDNHPYICKKPAGGTLPPFTTPTPPQGYCKEGWSTFDKALHCYKFFDGAQFFDGWDEARKICKEFGGDLASIHSDIEQAFIMTLQGYYPYKSWIGLDDSYSYQGQFLWSDQSEVTYTSWGAGEPNYRWDQRNCVYLGISGSDAGQWKVGDCSSDMGLVCQIPKEPHMPSPAPPTLPPSDNTTCPSGFVAYPPIDSCYMITTAPLSFDESHKSCHSAGGEVTSIIDPYEEAEIRILLADAFSQGQQAWIGLIKDKGVFKWIDGFPVKYTHWGAGQPTERGQDNCTVISQDGSWADAPCHNSRVAVCKFTIRKPPVQPTGYPGICPTSSSGKHPWLDGGTDSCYKIIDDNNNDFSDAAIACKTDKSDLASIHSETDAAFLKDYLMYHKGHFWIGYLRTTSDDWEWTDGSAVDYTNWGPNQPGRYTGDACAGAYIDETGLWSSSECYNWIGYICKTPKIMVTEPTQYTGMTSEPPVTFPPITVPDGGIIYPRSPPGWTSTGIAAIVLTVIIGVFVMFIGLLFFIQWRRGDYAAAASSPAATNGVIGKINSIFGSINGRPPPPQGFENITYRAGTDETSIGPTQPATPALNLIEE